MRYMTQGSPVPNQVAEALATILRSESFRTTPRLRALLQFTVLETLGGRQHELKESVLAVEVFGRETSYNPQSSSVVRVEFGRLRKKLGNYYAVEATNHAVRI